jgi:hypothetical protein
MTSLSFSLRGVGVLVAVGGMSLLHCAWLFVRLGVLCCIVIEGDPLTTFVAALGLTAAVGFLVRVGTLCVLAFHL